MERTLKAARTSAAYTLKIYYTKFYSSDKNQKYTNFWRSFRFFCQQLVAENYRASDAYELSRRHCPIYVIFSPIIISKTDSFIDKNLENRCSRTMFVVSGFAHSVGFDREEAFLALLWLSTEPPPSIKIIALYSCTRSASV